MDLLLETRSEREWILCLHPSDGHNHQWICLRRWSRPSQRFCQCWTSREADTDHQHHEIRGSTPDVAPKCKSQRQNTEQRFCLTQKYFLLKVRVTSNQRGTCHCCFPLCRRDLHFWATVLYLPVSSRELRLNGSKWRTWRLWSSPGLRSGSFLEQAEVQHKTCPCWRYKVCRTFRIIILTCKHLLQHALAKLHLLHFTVGDRRRRCFMQIHLNWNDSDCWSLKNPGRLNNTSIIQTVDESGKTFRAEPPSGFYQRSRSSDLNRLVGLRGRRQGALSVRTPDIFINFLFLGPDFSSKQNRKFDKQKN